jgi:hypothetical protein
MLRVNHVAAGAQRLGLGDAPAERHLRSAGLAPVRKSIVALSIAPGTSPMAICTTLESEPGCLARGPDRRWAEVGLDEVDLNGCFFGVDFSHSPRKQCASIDPNLMDLQSALHLVVSSGG